MKRKAESMLPYVVVATLVCVPAMTGFVNKLRAGYGVAGTELAAKKVPSQFASNPLPVRR
jgi:hypothetical protein